MNEMGQITAIGKIRNGLTEEYSFVLSFLLLVVIGRIVNDNFFTWSNISNLFVQGSMIGLISMGMTMVICAGMIDISVGSQVAKQEAFWSCYYL